MSLCWGSPQLHRQYQPVWKRDPPAGGFIAEGASACSRSWSGANQGLSVVGHDVSLLLGRALLPLVRCKQQMIVKVDNDEW
jgi:hypothetical protein